MSQKINVETKDLNTVRLTCDELNVSNLVLDLDMLKPQHREGGNGSSNPRSTGYSTQPLKASDNAEDGKFHLLLAASGSVATIKIPNIVQGLSKHKNISIRIILTESAAKFLQGQSEEQPSQEKLASYPNVDAIYRDEDEWKKPWVRGDPILHIELRRWADLLVIAPLSANTLAKISNGLCDNLLTSVVRAWEVVPTSADATPTDDSSTEGDSTMNAEPKQRQKRIIIAPAMNTAMWRHPLTTAHLRAPHELYHWFDIMKPIEKELACGDTGDGAMCDWNNIVSVIGVHIEMSRLGIPMDTSSLLS